MKKRIVALILTVVMSLLALSSCGSFNFAKEDLGAYASFNYEEFKAALKALEIEDGDFTTNEETRAKLVAAKIYNAVADKIISATHEDDRVKEGELSGGDVLYFVYSATDSEGNLFFGSDMNTSAITASSTKANHVIKLGDYFDEEDEFFSLIKDNLKNVDIADYVYSILTSSDLSDDELGVKAEDTIVVSYTRTHKSTDSEGVETEIKESAAYETIDLSGNHILATYILAEDSVAKVGGTLGVFDSKDAEGKVTTKTTFDVVVEDENGEQVTYTYSNVKILWKVEKAGQPIATFEYAPYDSDKKVTPDNLTSTTAEKVNLKDVKLTYTVYPVYAIDAPSNEEMTAVDILYNLYGSKLVETSFEVLGEEGYKNGEDTVADLLEDVANIFDTDAEDNEYYADGTDLKTLLDAHDKAVEDGGSDPTDEQEDAIDAAEKALTDAQNALLKEVISKIAAATNGTKTVGEAVVEEYEEDTFHSLKETYDADIIEKVQAAVWELIDKSVTITGYPEKLLKEYTDHLYEYYEYEYYKGDFSSSVTNYDKYDSFDAYLIATLKLTDISDLDAALEKEAKGYIDTLLKIYVVAKECENDALAVMSSYIEADITGGTYNVNEESYREAYGDAADEKIEEAKKTAEENIEAAREEAKTFVIDDAFMKNYKKEVGSAYYRSLIEEYGEINLRAAFQFNKLFYYLTSTNVELNEDGDHVESSYVEIDGVKYIDFRTVKYTIKAEEADAE